MSSATTMIQANSPSRRTTDGVSAATTYGSRRSVASAPVARLPAARPPVKRQRSYPSQRKLAIVSQQSPQDFLDKLLVARGYSTERFKGLETAYYNEPTPLQVASHASHVVDLVRRGDALGLERVLEAGLSPNPCNEEGESLVHTACRRGHANILQTLIDHDCAVQVVDKFGRTPLHDACWASTPCFDVVELLVSKDHRFFYLEDCSGATPLSYTSKHLWSGWIEFLDANKDEFWPVQNTTEGPPSLALDSPNSRMLPVPKNALTLELAALVASGQMQPKEAIFMAQYEDITDLESESDDESVGQLQYDDLTIATFDEAEMAGILKNLSCRSQKPLAWSI